MAIKKSELYSILWEGCNHLRSKGSMDASQYKDYVLIILFIKVITDKYLGKKDALVEIPEDANFNTLITLKGKKNIGEECNKIIAKICEVNPDLNGVIDIVDFNDESKLGKGKDLIDSITGLISVFQNENLNFKNNRADNDDILGDAYEYLMKQFATESGKSKGQFYTPAEVSRVMAKLLGINRSNQKQIYIYDMTCGSGSLLLKACAEAKEGTTVNAYGQEKDGSTAGLAVMNMYLHGFETAEIKIGNTLTSPQFLNDGKIKQFDYCVANPPFSVKKWGADMTNDYGRFEGFGMPPDNCADYAFLLHMLKSMNSSHGRGAIILPHGVLFRSGQEEIIRKALIRKGYIEGIIGLPSNLFYGTGIPACIIILDKEKANIRKNIFIIDASKGFIKDGNKNRLKESDIKKIVDTYVNRKEIEKYSKNVNLEEIEKQEYNLNISRYIDSNDEEMVENLVSHIQGGISENDLNKFKKIWDVAPDLKEKIFQKNDKNGYYDLIVDENKISEILKKDKDFEKIIENFDLKILNWEKNNLLNIVDKIDKVSVKELIENISENLLNEFKDETFFDEYELYQILLEYVNRVMKDDLYLIKENGYIPELRYQVDAKGKTKVNDFDSDLIPKKIIIEHFFNKEQDEMNLLNLKKEELENIYDDKLDEVKENFEEDEKINEKNIKLKLNDDIDIDIKNKLQEMLKILIEIKNIKEKSKLLENEMLRNIKEKYSNITEEESKNIIINEKWIKNLNKLFKDYKNSLINNLSNGLINLVNKYSYTLKDIDEEIKSTEKELAEMLKNLEGNDNENNALKDLIGLIKGEN